MSCFYSCKTDMHYIPVNNIRTVQELLGDADIATTQIHAHVMRKGANAVLSPLDA